VATIRTIERKKGMVYKAIVRTHGQILTRTFHTKSDATKWGKRTEQQLQQEASGLVSEGHRRKLLEASQRYRAEILPTKELATQNGYGGHLDYWEKQLGHLKLADVSPQLISKCRDELAGENLADADKA